MYIKDNGEVIGHFEVSEKNGFQNIRIEVDEDHRLKGIGSRVLKDYIREHGGNYSADVTDRGTLIFLRKIFNGLGYKERWLDLGRTYYWEVK